MDLSILTPIEKEEFRKNKSNPTISMRMHNYNKLVGDFEKGSLSGKALDIEKYLAVPSVQRLGEVDCACTIGLMPHSGVIFRSVLMHSINVARLAFALSGGNYEIAIAGLLHDIASPAGKHLYDIVLGDMGSQEKTEKLNLKIIRGDAQLMALLAADGLDPVRISNPKNYPILDCPLPGVCVDRFEYTMANALLYNKAVITDIRVYLNAVKFDENTANWYFIIHVMALILLVTLLVFLVGWRRFMSRHITCM